MSDKLNEMVFSRWRRYHSDDGWTRRECASKMVDGFVLIEFFAPKRIGAPIHAVTSYCSEAKLDGVHWVSIVDKKRVVYEVQFPDLKGWSIWAVERDGYFIKIVMEDTR